MLELRGVTKAYGGRTVFDSVTLSLRAGEILCLTGPSGVGKTTLLEIAAGVAKPDTGTVTRGAKAALMFQDDVLIPWLTAEETVAYIFPPGMDERERKEKATFWLRTFGLEGTAYPAAMSGGMRRRLSLARTLAAERPLMFLDEPFAFLDAAHGRTIVDLTVAHVRNGGAVMLATHSMTPFAGVSADVPIRTLAFEACSSAPER